MSKTAQGLFAALQLAGAIIASTSLAASPSGPRFEFETYDGLVCNDSTRPPLDYGTVATKKTIYFWVKNVGDTTARHLTVTLSGADVPAAFNYPGGTTFCNVALKPGYRCTFFVSFTPPADDPSGTAYGGSVSEAVITASDPKAPTLRWVLKGQKE